MASIYVASSWRNTYQPAVVRLLRSDGHEVYDFRAPAPGKSGFSWSEIDPDWQSWTLEQYRSALRHPIAQAGYESDIKSLMRASATLLVQPAGRSAHLELGFAVGLGQMSAVWFPESVAVEPELMAKMADEVLIGPDELTAWSKALCEMFAKGGA